MSAAKKSIWFNPDVEYIGATGVSSVHEMADLMMTNEPDLWAEILQADEQSAHAFAAVLEELNTRAITVPTAYLKQEQWDNSHVVPTSFDGKPGRGRVKVLGVSL